MSTLRKAFPLLLVMLMLMLGGCSSTDETARNEAVEKVSAPFAAGAITVQLRAEPGLNMVNSMPNSCVVLLLQAKDQATLDKVLGNPGVLKGLFAGEGAGGGGEILQVDRYPMMPGQTNTLHIDRAMNTRSVALVAGYYPFPAKQHMTHIDVPVESHSTGWWSPQWTASLTPLTMAVTLGSDSIIETGSESVDEKGNEKIVEKESEKIPKKINENVAEAEGNVKMPQDDFLAKIASLAGQK